METRLATSADVQALAALHAESFGAARWSEAQFADSLALPTNEAWLAQENGAAYGFILCQNVGEEAEVLTFCVAPAARRKGVGRILLHKAVEAALQRKAKKMFLEVAVDNEAALALYAEAGFRTIGRRRGYYAHEGKNIDAALLCRELEACCPNK